MMTSAEGIFACGNVLHVHDLVDFVTRESEKAGRSAAEYINNGAAACGRTQFVPTKMIPENGVRYIVPQTVNIKNLRAGDKFLFRVDNIYRNCKIILKSDDDILYSRKKIKAVPSEMESIEITEKILNGLGKISDIKNLVICLEK